MAADIPMPLQETLAGVRQERLRVRPLWVAKVASGTLWAYDVAGELRLILVYDGDNGYEVFRPAPGLSESLAREWLRPSLAEKLPQEG